MAVSKKVKRDLSKSKSWLQRTCTPSQWTQSSSQRGSTAFDLKFHRRNHFNLLGYTRVRGFKWLKKQGFDFKRWVKACIPKKGKLNVLNSGAGFMVLDADLKKAFGDKVFVTSLNVLRPQLTKKLEQKLLAEIEAEKTPKIKLLMQANFKKMQESKENIKLVDEFKVSPIETFSSRKQYGAILDLAGPLFYSPNTERVLEKYLFLLEPKASLFTDTPLTEAQRRLFGPKGRIAQEKGYYFRATKISRIKTSPPSEIWELKKILKRPPLF